MPPAYNRFPLRLSSTQAFVDPRIRLLEINPPAPIPIAPKRAEDFDFAALLTVEFTSALFAAVTVTSPVTEIFAPSIPASVSADLAVTASSPPIMASSAAWKKPSRSHPIALKATETARVEPMPPVTLEVASTRASTTLWFSAKTVNDAACTLPPVTEAITSPSISFHTQEPPKLTDAIGIIDGEASTTAIAETTARLSCMFFASTFTEPLSTTISAETMVAEISFCTSFEAAALPSLIDGNFHRLT